MVHVDFSLVFNISLELCFLGLAKFPLETPFVLDTFWRLLEPKQANVSKGGRNKLCVNIGREDKRGKF
jgi:hypothetical protein